MKARDIIAQWRREVDDTVEPYLWSDEEALDYLNDAENQAARRLRYFVESANADIAMATVPTTGIVALDARVLFVKAARIQGRLPLRMMTMQELTDTDPYWQDASASLYPEVYVPDFQTGALRVHPKPTAQLSLLMTVVRDPLTAMANLDATPEIAARYHAELRHWLSHRAYLKPDQETYDPKKSQEAEVRFANVFGAPSSAMDEIWNQRNAFDHDGMY